MSREQHARASALFIAARDVPPQARRNWLEQACSHDLELQREVETLLAHHDRATDFLERPAIERGYIGDALERMAREVAQSPVERTLPDRIGRFRILGLIGTGGMGVVYLAEQDEPRRSVALKVIQASVASAGQLRRFQLEAALLARLQHPGVAQIFEAGTDDRGSGPQPYFAMELVRGRSLLEHARSRALGVPERLALLVETCEAVHHAHQKGIVHRDLKPGNILVDESGHPKILDFGVARATDSDLQRTTCSTHTGAVVGTLPYMSPEQVDGRSDAIDARSDVYALGVIGYELLAGRLPLDLRGRSLPEAARIIREEEPVRLGMLDRDLRGDVETIVARALEKERERRYGSAAELAADIERFQRDEPIVARPPSAAYQLRKFVRRNRAVVAGSVATLLALLGAVSATSVGLTRARDAEAAARSASSRRDALSRYLVELVSSADPDVSGRDVRLADVLHKAQSDLAASFAGDPESEVELRATIGWTLYRLGRPAEAEPHMRRVFEFLRGAQGLDDPTTLEWVTRYVPFLAESGHTAEAESIARLAVEHCERKFGADSPHALRHTEHLGVLLLMCGRHREAEAILERTCAGFESLGAEYRDDVAASLNNRASICIELGRFAEAEELARRSLAIGAELVDRPASDSFAARTALAVALRRQDKLADALGEYDRLLDDMLALYDLSHPEILGAVLNRTRVLRALGRVEEAEIALRETLEFSERVHGRDAPSTLDALLALAQLVSQSRRRGEADELSASALARCRAVEPPGGKRLLEALGTRASVMFALGRYAAAEELSCERLDWLDRLRAPPDRESIDARHILTHALVRQQRFAEAEPQLLIAFQDQCALDGMDSPTTAGAIRAVASFYGRWERPDQERSFLAMLAEPGR